MWELIQAFFLFGLVLVLAWLTTRLVGQRTFGAMRGRIVRVLEHIPAGRDRSIMLLEVGGRVYLVGATGEQISLLDAIEDPDTIRRILAQMPSGEPTPLVGALPESFKEILSRFRTGSGMAAGGQADRRETAMDDSAEIERLEQQLERLRRLKGK